MIGDPLANGCLGVVARSPRTVRKHVTRKIVDHGIEDHAIAARRDEGRICFEFRLDVVVRVIAVERTMIDLPGLASRWTSSMVKESKDELSTIDPVRQGVRSEISSCTATMSCGS